MHLLTMLTKLRARLYEKLTDLKRGEQLEENTYVFRRKSFYEDNATAGLFFQVFLTFLAALNR